MAVFMDTGGGDIYAGETEEACLAAMREDIGDANFAEIEKDVREVSGDAKVGMENEDGTISDQVTTLAEEYTDIGHGYCIASSNC